MKDEIISAALVSLLVEGTLVLGLAILWLAYWVGTP